MLLRQSTEIELHWRDWGEDSVAFEARSGARYQFDPLSAAVMACFEGGPTSVEAVQQMLAADLDAADDAALAREIGEIVDKFRAQGWLVPIIAA
ncbi:MAG: hypothetical protein KGL18_11910 [Burkholderiales bacterium]|nr:hypothetical protein [Burkholderiales bacterium]MDE1925715.1 hypothetical protein [Burkholderiales bacterium]MDE2157646.1 hypothetical protein [Burkholderiales bacterium]MDE2503661.1 hypothetical protein [Burkholderiales bacterium]